MNKTIIYKSLAAAAVLALSSCVKDDLYNTPHPDYGVAAVALVLPEGASSDGFYIEISGTPYADSDGTYYFSNPLVPGEHDVLAHNYPEGMSVTGGIATVNAADGSALALDNLIDPLPEHLYSGKDRILIEADDTTRLHLDMVQRTRDLHIELTIPEGDPETVISITGVLEGVAGAYDLWNETLYGDAVSTCPEFSRDGATVTADLRLLGIMGSVQMLTFYIVFTNGETLVVESDLTESLAGFNDSKDSFTLTGRLHILVEADFEASIIDWEQTDGGNFDAR